MGNVCDVNILKEKVTVRLDDRPDSPQCYHNCEVCVLRNGKGSRDGIEIPAKRPARYVEERKSEESDVPEFFADFTSVSDLPTAEERGEKRRRQRGGRKSGEGKPESAKTAQNTEKQAEKMPAQPDAPKSEGGEKHRRGHRGGRRNKKPAAAAAPAAPAAPKTSAAPAAPAAPKTEGGEKKRPRHRGGRRHRGNGSKNNTPKAEG